MDVRINPQVEVNGRSRWVWWLLNFIDNNNYSNNDNDNNNNSNSNNNNRRHSKNKRLCHKSWFFLSFDDSKYTFEKFFFNTFPLLSTVTKEVHFLLHNSLLHNSFLRWAEKRSSPSLPLDRREPCEILIGFTWPRPAWLYRELLSGHKNLHSK